MTEVSSVQQMSLARATAARADVLRVYNEGGGKRERKWGDDLPSLPFMVYLADEAGRFTTLAFDFDAKTEGSAEVAQADAAELADELRALGLRFVMTESGPTGGRHVILTVRGEGLPADVVRDLAEGIEVAFSSFDKTPLCNPKKGAIRPPLSPHRNGGRSELLGISAPEALAILEDGNDPERILLLLERFPVPTSGDVDDWLAEGDQGRDELSSRAKHLLRYGDEGGDFKSRSELVFSILCSAVRAGMSGQAIYKALLLPSNIGGERVRELVRIRGAVQAERYMQGEWRRARAASSGVAGPRSSLAEHRALVEHEIFCRSWDGRTGITDRLVLAAHLSIALGCGSSSYRASDRQLSIQSGIGRKSVCRSNQILIHRGLLQRIETGKNSEGSSWILLPNTTHQGVEIASPCSPCVLLGYEGNNLDPLSVLLSGLGSDAFVKDGLGASALVMWSILAEAEPSTVAEIAARLTLSRKGTYSVLGRLAASGLASRSSDGWRRNDADLLTVTEQLGTAGTTQLRSVTYENERETYRRTYDVAANAQIVEESERIDQLLENLKAASDIPAELECVSQEAHA